MVQYIRYRVPDLAYPRFQFFKDRLESIYPRFRKAVAKKTWKTTTEDSIYAAEEEKLLKGPLRETAEFQLSNHVEKSVLDDLVSDVYPTTQLTPEIWVLGQHVPLAKYIQSSKFPKDQKAMLRIQTQTIVPVSSAPFVVVLMVDLRSTSADWKQVILNPASGDKIQLQTLATRDDFLIFVQEDTGSSEAEVKQHVLRELEQHFAAIVKEESIVVNAGLGDKICNRLEVQMIRKFDKIMDYICRFPCQVPPHFAEELDDKQSHLLGVLTDGLEDMVCKRWITLDLWLGEIQNKVASLDHEIIYKQVRLAIAKRLRNILLQELSPTGGMTQMLINAAVESVIDIPMLFESTLDEELERKLRDIINQQLHLDFLTDHFTQSKISPKTLRAKDVRQAYASHIQHIKETSNCDCARTVHRREYRVFAASVMQSIRISIIVQKLITSMTVADNTLLTLHKLRFEVLGVQRQTIAKENYDNLYQTEEPSGELVERLKLIDGVAGWGLIYGRLHVHLKLQDKKILSQIKTKLFHVLKPYYADFTIETVTSPPKFLVHNVHQSGAWVWCVRAGTLGCFVYEENDRRNISFLTCAHVVEENRPVFVKHRGKKIEAGTARYLINENAIDVAAVKADRLRGYYSERFDNPCLHKLPGQLFEGNLISSEISAVFKEGATTSSTRGIIASPQYQRVEGINHLVLIEALPPADSFAAKGDSGAVVCAHTADCQKVHLISMITSGDMRAGSTKPLKDEDKSSGSSSEEMAVEPEEDNGTMPPISSMRISQDYEEPLRAGTVVYGKKKLLIDGEGDVQEQTPSAKKLKTDDSDEYSFPTDLGVQGAVGGMGELPSDDDIPVKEKMDIEASTSEYVRGELQLTESSESEPEIEELDSEGVDQGSQVRPEVIGMYDEELEQPEGIPKYNFVTSFRLDEGIRYLNIKSGKSFHVCGPSAS